MNTTTTAAASLDALTAEFRAWTLANGFTAADGDAGDILHSKPLAPDQRAWLESFSVRWDAAAEAPTAPAPAWACPVCGDTDVQICLPAWFKETAEGVLTYVEADGDADVRGWYCEKCNESDSGEPERVDT